MTSEEEYDDDEDLEYELQDQDKYNRKGAPGHYENKPGDRQDYTGNFDVRPNIKFKPTGIIKGWFKPTPDQQN